MRWKRDRPTERDGDRDGAGEVNTLYYEKKKEFKGQTHDTELHAA